jgi:hypothetical protein
VLENSFYAEVIVGGEHLRLFSENGPLGVQASVYNMTARNWVAPSEAVRDIEEGKDRASEYAMSYLDRVLKAKLPVLVWKNSRSA